VKQPIEADFDVQIRDADVEITFTPMTWHYSFRLRSDRLSVSPKARVRYDITDDAGDYALGEVEAMAFRVACAAIKAQSAS
jgi:hypothetical protein